MAFPMVASYYFLKFRIVADQGSWSEKYPLLANSWPAAQTAASAILNARVWLLPYLFYISRASIGNTAVKGGGLRLKYPQDFATALGTLLAGETTYSTDGACNDDDCSLLFRFDNGQGKFNNHWLRGIRDSWVTNDALTVTLPAPYAQNVTGNLVNGVTVPTAAVALNNFLSIVRDTTALYQPSGVPSTPWNQILYNVATGGNWQFMRVTNRRTGAMPIESRGRKPVMS